MRKAKTSGIFLKILMENVCSVQSAPRWAECTPLNIHYIDEILETFSSAKIIHMIRDGRDVAVSMAKQKWLRNYWGGDAGEVYSCAVYWDWITKIGIKNSEFYPNNVLQVKYENLIGDMESELAKIGNFIGKKLERDDIYTVGIGSVSNPNTSFNTGLDKKDFSPIGRWKNILSEKTAAGLEQIIRPELLKLEYENPYKIPKAKMEPLLFLKTKMLQTYFSFRHFVQQILIRKARKADLTFLNIKEEGTQDPTFRPADNLHHIREIIGNR
jgi:hypothetical protein